MQPAYDSTTATLAIAGQPAGGWLGGLYADDSRRPDDAVRQHRADRRASILMAHELGYFKKFGIDS
jgi:hypothetical protein